MSKKFRFIPSVSRSDVMRGDNESEDAMWKGVSENDTDLSLMVRELIQNSIDANESKRAEVSITLKTIDFSFIDFKGLIESVDYSIEETKKENTKGRLLAFKKEIEEDLNNLKCLVVEDESGGLDGSSRFEEGGLRTIVGENYSEKTSSALGSFGVGKSTAIRLSSFGSIFYLNQKNGSKKFIGKTVLSGFTKGERAFYGPNIFCGKESINGTEKVADWIDFKDDKKIRTLSKDGLTTIIPITSDKLVYKGVDWIEISKLSSIKSYFKDFENNKLVLTLNDEINKNKYEIKSSNYKNYYKESLNRLLDNEELSATFMHNLLVSKPYILNEELIDSQEKKLTIGLTNSSTQEIEKFEGKVLVKLYKNEELSELIETEKMPIDRTYNFRLIRESILIRNFKLPHYLNKRRLESNLYCGLVELINEKESKESKHLSELIRLLETQSHDTLDISKLSTVYENEVSERRFRSQIIQQLNRLIKEMIDEQIKEDKKNLKEIDINFDLTGNQGGNNNNDGGYYREVIGFGEKIESESISSSSSKGKGDESQDEDSKGTPGEGDEKLQGGKGEGGGNGEGGFGEETGDGYEDDNGTRAIIKRALQQPINYKSKRIYKQGKKAKYILRCDGLENTQSIMFYQDSIDGFKKSFRMFDIKSIKINGIKLNKSSITKDKRYEKVDFEFQDAKQQDIEVDLIEPEKSITEFHLKVIKQ